MQKKKKKKKRLESSLQVLRFSSNIVVYFLLKK